MLFGYSIVSNESNQVTSYENQTDITVVNVVVISKTDMKKHGSVLA